MNILDDYALGRFACNTRVKVDASSNPPLSHAKLLEQNLELIHQLNKSSSKSNGNSPWWQMVIPHGGKSHRVGV